MIRIFQWREGHSRTNTSLRRKKEIQKSRTVRVTIWDLSRKVNHLSKVIWDRKSITERRSKFASAVGKCAGFCRGISPFYSICHSNKNAEAVKFLEIFFEKIVFLELKKKFFVKEKKISFIKNNVFTRHKLSMCIYIHYSYLYLVYF